MESKLVCQLVYSFCFNGCSVFPISYRLKQFHKKEQVTNFQKLHHLYKLVYDDMTDPEYYK